MFCLPVRALPLHRLAHAVRGVAADAGELACLTLFLGFIALAAKALGA